MQTKNTFSIFFLLLWLAFVSACQESSHVPVGMPAIATTTQSIIITDLPTTASKTPENLPLVKSTIVTKSLPPKRGDTKVLLPTVPGDYLVYWTRRGFLQYVSLDGMVRGNLVEGFIISEFEPTLKTEGLDPVGMISEGGNLSFVFMKIKEENQLIKSAYIWVTDIFGNPIESWNISSNSEMNCLRPEFSPYQNWITMDCFHGDYRNINLINLKSGEVSAFTIECDPSPAPSPIMQPPTFIWSQNDSKFAYRCPFAEYYFLSISENDVILTQLGNSSGKLRILSVSPDWEKIVIDMGDMPKNTDGTVSVNRIHVADLDCILNDPDCPEATPFDLPLANPVDLTKNDYVRTQIYWISPWNSMAWLNSTMTTSSNGCIDLLTSINQDCRLNLNGQEYLGVSPDGQWLIFIGYIEQKDQALVSRYLYAVSVKDNTVRYLADPDANSAVDYIRFYGWLTVQ